MTRDTHSVSFCLFPRAPPSGHHRFQHGHPALLIREAGSHEVHGLARPTGGVGVRLQLQHKGDICKQHNHPTVRARRTDTLAHRHTSPGAPTSTHSHKQTAAQDGQRDVQAQSTTDHQIHTRKYKQTCKKAHKQNITAHTDMHASTQKHSAACNQ